MNELQAEKRKTETKRLRCRDRERLQLTGRDVEIVRFVGRLGTASVEHVAERFCFQRSRAYRRLAGLVHFGYLERHRVRHARPSYVATRQGLALAGARGRPS